MDRTAMIRKAMPAQNVDLSARNHTTMAAGRKKNKTFTMRASETIQSKMAETS